MKKYYCVLMLLVLATHGLFAQKKLEPIPDVKLDRKEPVVYEKEVLPIFVNKCFVCHSGKEINGKLDLSTYDKLMKGGKKGPAVIPGKSAESYLFQLCARLKKPIMPPSDEVPLTPQELALIKLWIDEGAKPPTSSGEYTRPKVVLNLPPALVKPVRAVGLSPDGKTVAMARGNQLHLFNTADGKLIKTLLRPELKTAAGKMANAAHISLIESMAYSADGRYLATGSFQEVAIWDMQKTELKQVIDGFNDRVLALHFSPDNKYLATGGGPPTEDGEIRVFETSGFQQVANIKNGHSDSVYGVCFSPDSTKLATCAADKFVKVWDVPAGKLIKSFEGHTHHVLDVGWRADNKGLVSCGADNVVKVWDFEKGEQTRTINAHKKQVTRLVFIPKTNKVLTVSGDESVKQWNSDNGGNERTFAGASDFLYCVAISADGKMIASGGEEGIVRVYDSNAKLLHSIYAPGDEPKPEKK
ncbi:MAG: c-type cytochrome domain-containing protein [Zavarzinella sp.]